MDVQKLGGRLAFANAFLVVDGERIVRASAVFTRAGAADRSTDLTMRPSLLDPLFAALTSLQGIGPKLAKLFARLTDRDPPRVVDLLFHLPSGTIDRRARPKLRDVVPDTVATVLVTVDRHRPPPPNRPRAPYQIYASDETGDITLTYFNARKDFLEKLLPVGERRYLSGTTAFYDGMLQMVHPDRVVSRSRRRQTAVDPAGLSLDRGPRPKRRAQGGRSGARACRLAGVAGRSLAAPARMAGVPRGAGGPASSRRSRRGRARNAGLVAARL